MQEGFSKLNGIFQRGAEIVEIQGIKCLVIHDLSKGFSFVTPLAPPYEDIKELRDAFLPREEEISHMVNKSYSGGWSSWYSPAIPDGLGGEFNVSVSIRHKTKEQLEKEAEKKRKREEEWKKKCEELTKVIASSSSSDQVSETPTGGTWIASSLLVNSELSDSSEEKEENRVDTKPLFPVSSDEGNRRSRFGFFVFLTALNLDFLNRRKKDRRENTEVSSIPPQNTFFQKKEKKNWWILAILVLLLLSLLGWLLFIPKQDVSKTTIVKLKPTEKTTPTPFNGGGGGGSVVDSCSAYGGQSLLIQMQNIRTMEDNKISLVKMESMNSELFRCGYQISPWYSQSYLAPEVFMDSVLIVQRGFSAEGKPYYEIALGWHQLITAQNSGETAFMLILQKGYSWRIPAQGIELVHRVRDILQNNDQNSIYSAVETIRQ